MMGFALRQVDRIESIYRSADFVNNNHEEAADVDPPLRAAREYLPTMGQTRASAAHRNYQSTMHKFYYHAITNCCHRQQRPAFDCQVPRDLTYKMRYVL